MVHNPSWRGLVSAFLVLAAAANALPGWVSAEDSPPLKKPAAADPLDRQLLDGLDQELLKGLPGQTASPPADRPGTAQNAPTDQQHPLAELAERMRGVESRLARRDLSAETTAAQQELVARIDDLLKQARQASHGAPSQKPGSGQGTPQAGAGTGEPAAAPSRDSSHRIERGTKETPETADVRDVMRRLWGHLPDKMREEMQASLTEQFLPKYERLIEEYYRRLAEDRSAGP